MIYKEEVCMWFKNNESHRRLELLCGLLNMCLPFELRFIRTCAEDLGKRDDLLRDFDSKANNSSEISQLEKILDERTRSKFIVYVALLEANNHTCSKILFETLSNAQEIPNSALSSDSSDKINYIKEMLLIYTMVLHHPAFTFEEKRVIGERFKALQVLDKEISHGLTQTKKDWSHNNSPFALAINNQEIPIESCHPISSPQIFEACDSGLSIGTEPEVEVLSDHVCAPASIHLPHDPSSSSTNITFEGETVTHSNSAMNSTSLTPSIETTNSIEKLPSSSVTPSSEPSSIIQHVSSTENREPGPSNRDASSSGSGESLDLYGESVSVPTTYIYNSNIYDHQNLSEVPAVAMNSNLINLMPGYMYQHNGRCHFYHYPSLMGGVFPPSVSVPRKMLPANGALSSETSSGEEGGSGVSLAQGTKLTLLRGGTAPSYSSSLSSSQSSPYASPPQSPKGITVTTSAPSLASPAGLVTGTTTSIVLSKSSPRPPIRNVTTSHPTLPSSLAPVCSTSQSLPRNKLPGAAKGPKNAGGERSSTSRGHSSLHQCSGENSTNCNSGHSTQMPTHFASYDSVSAGNKDSPITNVSTVSSPSRTYVKVNGRQVDPKSAKTTVVTSCGSSALPLSNESNPQSVMTVVSNTLPDTTLVPSCNSYKDSNNSVLPNLTTPVSMPGEAKMPNQTLDAVTSQRANNMNVQEENHIKENSLSLEVKSMEECEGLKALRPLEKDGSAGTLPNGFNEYRAIPSAQVTQLKHSTSQNTSVTSCSCQTAVTQSDSPKISSSNIANKVHLIPPPISHHTVSDGASGKSISIQGRNGFPSESPLPNCVPSVLQTTVSPKPPFSSPGLHYSVMHSTNLPSSKSSLPCQSSSSVTVTSSYTNGSVKHPTSGGSSNHLSATVNHPLTKVSHSEYGHPGQPPLHHGQIFGGNTSKLPPTVTTIPTFTTTTSSSTTVVSLVPSSGTYPPYFSIPVLHGGTSSYPPQGSFPHHSHAHGPPRAPSQTFFLASPSAVVQGPPTHTIKGHPHAIPPHATNLNHSKSRGSSSGRSGNNSSGSGSSGVGRKKTLVRGGPPHQNKSRSSDSSPSSSQYSSPPQTPSPDHTKDARAKNGKGTGKPKEGYPIDEGWEPSESNAGPCLPCGGSREEGTPPPHAVGPHLMIPSNPARHQRYVPYHPLGFIGYTHPHPHGHGVYRYSLASPSVVMGPPRPPTPLGSEKSSRETTPPTHPHPHPHSHPHPGPPPLDKGSDYAPLSSSTSSASPPVPGPPMADASSVTLVPPPPGPPAAHVGPPNGTLHQYNAPNYPMFAMGTGPFVAHLSNFLPSSSALPNGYNLPSSFPVPSVTPGMNSGGGELIYPPGPYPVLPQTTLPVSSCGGGVTNHPSALHQSSGGAHTLYTPAPYQTALPPAHPVPPPVKKPLSCYNCGKVGHHGAQCKEASIDEMTKRTKVL